MNRLTDEQLINKWNELKDMGKWASIKLTKKIGTWQAELQREAKKRGINL